MRRSLLEGKVLLENEVFEECVLEKQMVREKPL
jgi:hypothetical protein